METVQRILKKYGYTRNYLKECEEIGICNGMGGQGGVNVTDLIRELHFFESKKFNKLLDDLDLISDIHDLQFYKGGGLLDFIKYNYQLAKNIIQLLHWTKKRGRIFIFLVVFLSTTIFGFKYYKRTKLF